MSANPVLIQRPIITADDGTTVIGRSEAAVQQALDGAGRRG
jgi:arsenate reductase